MMKEVKETAYSFGRGFINGATGGFADWGLALADRSVNTPGPFKTFWNSVGEQYIASGRAGYAGYAGGVAGMIATSLLIPGGFQTKFVLCYLPTYAHGFVKFMMYQDYNRNKPMAYSAVSSPAAFTQNDSALASLGQLQAPALPTFASMGLGKLAARE